MRKYPDHGLLATRILLGVFEAGFFPGAVYLCSYWYMPKDLTTRISYFYCASALSGAFSGLLAADTYKAMEKLLSTGKVRAIGVSNFTINRLDDLLSKTSAVPAVNQIEVHPYLQQPSFFDYCKSKNICVEAYSPLGNNQTGEPRTVDDELVGVLGKRLGLDGGQLLASWGIQHGHVVLPKSVTLHRIESNLQVKELPQDAYEQLSGPERHKRFNQQSRWGFDIFEELGQAKVSKIAQNTAEEKMEKFTV